MEKLSTQDAGFLKVESAHCPFHVAGLMIFKKPADAPQNYLRKLAQKAARLNDYWPVFNKKLSDPVNVSSAGWVSADDYQPQRHIYHYSLPPAGRMDDLMQLVTRAHERPLDRTRPLWELHVIDGLPRDRFALYCKVHHALVDGVGALRMMQTMFSTSAEETVDFGKPPARRERRQSHQNLFQQMEHFRKGLLKQSRALPELSGFLAQMGVDALQGKKDAMRLPFTSPRTLFNTQLDSHRAISICDVPLNQARKMAREAGGSINDVLLAVCGGALRRYLLEQNALPKKSMIAGMPVSLKSEAEGEGNRLSYIMSPFFTDEADDLRRLQRIIKVTGQAKTRLAKMSTTASEDYYALIMAPTILLTMTGNASRVRPATNAIFSNVPGSAEKRYFEGAELEALYPLSIVTDGMGLNITVVSHVNKLCFAVASCPTGQPGVQHLARMIKDSFRDLRMAM